MNAGKQIARVGRNTDTFNRLLRHCITVDDIDAWAAALRIGDKAYTVIDYTDPETGMPHRKKRQVTIRQKGRYIAVTDQGVFSYVEMYLATIGRGRGCKPDARMF